jgi:hypothetical protein
MMTIVTRVKLKAGRAPEWDAAMRERLETARERPGRVGGQLLMPPFRASPGREPGGRAVTSG